MRKLLTFALAFSGAVFAVQYGLWPLLVLLPLSALYKREHRRLRAALVLAGLVVGLLWCRGYDAFCRAPARAMEGQTATLEATVADWPWATGAGGGVTLQARGYKIRLYAGPETLDLRPGDAVTFAANCRSPELSRGQTTRDLTAKGIFLVAYAAGDLTVTRPERIPFTSLPAYWSRALKGAIADLFPPDAAALIRAVVTGDKGELPEGDYTALRRAGLAHGVAVSGMHLSFLVMLVAQLLGKDRRRTALIALPLLWAFALTAGATPSVLRAAVMQTVLLLAPLVGRESDGPTSLAFALLLLLAQNPYAAGSVSLQLSFAAVAGILAFTQRISDWTWGKLTLPKPNTRLRRLGRGLANFLVTTLATTLGAIAFTTPLVAYYFGSITLIAPLTNLLCLPALSLVFTGGLLSAVLGLLFHPLGQLLALVVTPVARYLLWVSSGLADVPFASVTTESLYYRGWLLLAYGLLLAFLILRGERRPLVPLCCGITALCAAALFTRISYTAGPLTVTVLDVGQGQSVLLRAEDRIALVDCGGNEGNAGDIAADYLGNVGRNRLDLLVLTHFHTDHANGVPELLERLRVDVLAVPEVEEENPLRREILDLAAAQGTQIVTITQNRTLVLGAADLTLYAPLGAGEANEAGLSVLCQAAGFSVLLTGDMDQTIEARLVKYGGLPDVDLLLAGHHGAKSATSQTLLDAVTPEVAVASAGYNSYGHPSRDTLLRLEAMGCAIYRTDLQGNITITVR